MSHFYGYLTGNRGTATRCGSKDSGIRAHIKSWNNDVHATLSRNPVTGADRLILNVPKGLETILNGKKIKM